MNYKLLSSLLCFSLAVKSFALPKDHQVQSGASSFNLVDSNTLEIKPSDQAIINYSKFDIEMGEKVKFIQNSSSSCVLNRVQGNDPSRIFGSLESNGKVFLVNSNGIYFGPQSKVNVGSFIASTLDIADTDFLQENYRFNIINSNSEIQNEGLIESLEGSIAIMASNIQNLGSITAKAGTVFLASAEHVLLDFVGDGLIQFSIEGALKESLISHLGDITASIVQLKIPTAKKAISEIVNLNGIEEGDIFIEENGVIKFASASTIQADQVHLQAAKLEVEGLINASSFLGKGGTVHLFGKDIVLEGATINASGKLGGGEVLIGGEFQGKGTTPYASKVLVDENSLIFSNAIEDGDGGLVVLWSRNHTRFNGKIEAKGGSLSGNGGVVETSAQKNLEMQISDVDTSAANGLFGEWLLDPGFIEISDVIFYPACPAWYEGICYNGDTCILDPSSFTSSNSNVTIQSTGGIAIIKDVIMSNTGVGITFSGCNGASSVSIQLDTPNIKTHGGHIIFNSASIFVETPVLLDSTLGGGSGDITISNLETFSGSGGVYTPQGITITAGAGGAVTLNTITSDPATGYTAPAYIIINSASKLNSSSIATSTTTGFSMPTSIPLVATGSSFVFDTTAGGFISGSEISLGTVYANSSSTELKFQAGSSQIEILGNIGDTNSSYSAVTPSSVNIASASQGSFKNITANNNITISTPSTFSTGSMITSEEGVININNSITVPGTLTTSSSSLIFNNAVTLSGDLVASVGSIVFNGNLTINGDLTASSSTITFAQSLILNGASTIWGASGINLNGISGSYPITLRTASSPIKILGEARVSNLTISDANTLQTSSIYTNPGSINISIPVTITGDTTFSSTGGDVQFSSTLSPSTTGLDLVLYSSSGSVTLPDLDGNAYQIGSVTLTGNSVVLESSLNALGNVIINNSGPFYLDVGPITSGGSFSQTGSGTITLDYNILAQSGMSFSSDITVTDNITLQGLNGMSFGGFIVPNALGFSLTLNAGTKSITVPAIGSVSFPMESVTITGGGVTLSSAIKAASLDIYNSSILNITVPISLSGSFHQAGTSSTTLAENITASSVSFVGDLSLKADNIEIEATAGSLTFKGISESNSNTQTLTLITPESISTIGTLATNILVIDSAPMGISIGNYLTLTDSCSITLATGDISIAGDFQVTGTSGIASLTALAGNISIGGDLSVTGGASTTSITANAGTLNIGNQLKATDFTISAANVTVGNGISSVNTGTITATGTVQIVNSISATSNFSIIATNATFANLTTIGGAILVDSPVTIKGSAPKVSSSGGDITFTSSIIPSSTTPDLTIDGGTGNITVTGSLGSESTPFDDITIIGCEVSIGNYYVNGNLNIENCSTLTMPNNDLSVGGDFLQSGVGPISLAFNITAGRVLYFTSPVTILENLKLIGNRGIDFEGPVFAAVQGLSLSLNAPSSLIVLHNVGTGSIPFQSIYISGSNIALKGIIESNILEFNGKSIFASSDLIIKKIFNAVPKSNFFVPGLYSSWQTFFDDEYFQVSPVNLISNQ